LFDKFPGIDEFDFQQLSPYVMQFYIESYKHGNPRESKEQLRYLSKRFILVENKLGMGTEFVAQLFKQTSEKVLAFRKVY
jgi:hypothetical protein